MKSLEVYSQDFSPQLLINRLLFCHLFLFFGILFSHSQSPVIIQPTCFVFDNIKNSHKKTIEEKIVSVFKNAEKIQIDGKMNDWEDIPYSESDNGNIADASRDIVKTSIAPMKDYLLIAIYTKGIPSKEAFSFYLNLNTTKLAGIDFQIGLNYSERGNSYRIFTKHGENYRGAINEIELAIDEIVEAKIPWKVLLSFVDSVDRENYLSEFNNQRFVRVSPFTFINSTGDLCDNGKSYASYKLSLDSIKLDSDLPVEPKEFYIIGFPFSEKWFLSVGPWANGHKWEYDFHIEDDYMKSFSGNENTKNEQYYSWNKQVISPCDGIVTRIEKKTNDNTPQNIPAHPGLNNGVWLKTNDKYEVVLVHFKKNGVIVNVGDKVSKGDLLGNCGNSGSSWQPHIHFVVRSDKNPDGIPIMLQNVKVSINPYENDPWIRELDEWVARQGYFIENF